MDLFEKCSQFDKFLRSYEAIKQGCYPYFVPNRAINPSESIIEGEKKIMIGSNNYLGLTHHPKVLEAAAEAVKKYGSGCTGSRFLNGTLDLHVELEERLAEFVGKPATLLFSTGYQTNLGVLHALLDRRSTAFLDADSHACIVDGAMVSFGKMTRFKHNDVDDLKAKLNLADEKTAKLVATDGVFSMSGAVAKLPELLAASESNGARIMVDDAHSIGVLGDTGAGTAEHFGVTDQVDLITATFSKSFGSIGGFAAGDPSVINYLKHNSRSFIFSASPPASAAATVLAALTVIQSEPERREQLWRNTKMMLEGFRALGFNIGESETPIVPVIIGDDLRTFMFWRALLDAGIFVNAAVSPAVPPGTARLRTSYTAAHTESQLSYVLETFEKIGKKLGVL